MSSSNNCDPCNQSLNENESVASQLSNLVSNLFGTLTKTITNGRAVWSQACTPDDSLDAFPRTSGEGLICYLLRIFKDYFTPLIGIHSALNEYYKGQVVADTGTSAFYKAIIDVPVGVAIGNTTYWELILTAPTGATGATGAAGSGSAINYAIRTETATYGPSGTDAVIFCDPAGAMAINLPAATSVSGKWYKIVNRTGAFDVTITPNGADTINAVASYTLSNANESVEIVNDNSSNWSVWG